MAADESRQTAAEYFQKAYASQVQGDYQQAIDFYTRSIEAFPTAEAYTFRGWTYSFLGDYDRAIAECLEAIKVDPEFGNPYNDIGAYLIEQEKWDEAIPWFQKAMIAPRYEARPYPYFNLGRVYEHQHHWTKAKECYAMAYSLDKRYLAALAGLRRLRAMFN
ncbi:MAG: tetratricopeptide repeat protein [Terriglobales bacterium]